MTDSNSEIYQFGNYRLDGGERMLFDGERSIALAPKIFDTLLLLVRNGGRVLSKERMMAEIWEDSFVEENNLAQNISYLRRVLGESADNKFIETVPKFGYRFVAPVNQPPARIETLTAERTTARIFVRELDEPDEAREIPVAAIRVDRASIPALASGVPETRYVQNGDVNIAYQVVGDGDMDIVFVMGWVSHLEYFWKHHLFASFLNRLASFSRLILFDKRGTGLSDRVPLSQLPTLEQRMEDVHAVMDAVGSERAVLIGVSEGGPMCSLFAATYPDRTSAVVMIGTYAKRLKDFDYPWGTSPEAHQKFYDLMQRDWGKAVGIEARAPSMVEDEEFRAWWAEYLRNGASPGAAVALTKMNAEIDVRNVLPLVHVPTLVIHRTGDLCLKAEEGRYVAELIPGSKYVEFDGIDHLPFVGNQDEILDEIEEFLTGMRGAQEIDRVLATVVNVQIVRLPDGSEADMLMRAGVFVRRQIELFKGKEISIDRGGVTAAFDGPARAIRCATAINDSARRLNLAIRTGLHTGECEVRGDEYSGIAVELATLIANEAADNEILASRTVKDLVAGSGIGFSEHGLMSLGDHPDQWRLFRVAA
ncbi:MAG: alpha/beta fold hydrolase [Acidobacteria bacterium]|nr:alpha/beta fold hydrolase [Acidobacteriota bacterium]MBK8150449.1 alpha/beta fold hydrolase [Acidobacteriota bacterium]MBK8809320.1 alpha/beta fold hydrolase [Acidobacteriota bacterium]